MFPSFACLMFVLSIVVHMLVRYCVNVEILFLFYSFVTTSCASNTIH